MTYTPWIDLPFFPEQGKTLNFRGVSRMDFEQKNCREYQVLPQTTCTRNTYNFTNIKTESIKN